MPLNVSKIRAATRSSPLALRQTQIVIDEINQHFPEVEVEAVAIKTEGDERLDAPIAEIGGKAVFAAALEQALLSGVDEKEGGVDIAIHSAKDLSATLPEGIVIGAVLERGDPKDILIGDILKGDVPVGDKDLKDLSVDKTNGIIKTNAKALTIGTGSTRRRIQLAELAPNTKFVEVRGNIETRLRKLKEEDEMDAILLAKAALDRLGIVPEKSVVLDTDVMIPQVGQGTLAIECLSEDVALDKERQKDIAEILSAINHPETQMQLDAERGFLKELGGDCNIPAAAYAFFEGGTLKIKGMLALNPEAAGKKATLKIQPEETAAELGKRLAHHLRDISK